MAKRLRTTGELPLEGVIVVSLEQAVAAPFASRQLADLGARVIKVERPGGGDFARGYDKAVKGMSAAFIWLNRSKESLTLDLKHQESRMIISRLLEEADIFIQNLAPGAATRLGLSGKTLIEQYPRLIVCNISGYGTGGPYSKKKAYDLLIQCETGLVSITGTPDTPCKVSISIADIATGMYAYSGILTALYQRQKTGKGTEFEVSMLEALGEWMVAPGYFAAYGNGPPPRTGASHASIYPYGPFKTGDGKAIFFGIQNEREWKNFCEVVLGRPDLAKNPRFESNTKRLQNASELAPIIENLFQRLDRKEVLSRLEQAQIANANLNSAKEFWDHPQLKARRRWREIDSQVGTIKSILPPVTMEGVTPRMDPVPALGQHTKQILKELGYTDNEIDGFTDEGAI
jgi:itaconate CoA-transferase